MTLPRAMSRLASMLILPRLEFGSGESAMRPADHREGDFNITPSN
jgi:hypothetical protein